MPNSVPQADTSHPIQYATIPGQQIPMGFVQLTATGAAQTLGTIPTKTLGAQTVTAWYAEIQPVGNPISWRDDGTAPTATVGMSVPAGSELLYNGNPLSAFEFIATAGTLVNVSFYA
jgi:hypothetical protein